MLFVVTGASTGIGSGVARSLATRNHDVIAVARNEDRLEDLKKSIESRITTLVADLSTTSGRASVINKVKREGRVDGIIHAAGSHITPAEYTDLKADELTTDFHIHVTVPISLNNALEEELAGGRILFVDSYSASNLRVGWSGYSIVKAAAQMAARSAAEELTGSTVIRVFPGAVHTPLIDTLLSTQKSSPTIEVFKEMKRNGTLSNPDVEGEFIANILVTATQQQLEERETWDFNNSNDQIFAQA